MTAHRSSRVHWRTLKKHIKKEQGTSNSVAWQKVLQTFYPENVSRSDKKLIKQECEETLTQLLTQGAVGKALGSVDTGVGVVVWIVEDAPNDSTADANAPSDQAGTPDWV